MAAPPTPEPDASPAIVRSWFTTLSRDFQSVLESEAREIALKWKLGRGSELSYYDVGTFRDIFGAEAGTLLFGHATKELRSNPKKPGGSTGKTSTASRNREDRPKTDISGLRLDVSQ